jgi:hypothetical protein
VSTEKSGSLVKLGMPWPRLFAEGVVICASVIIALAADAWWDGREDEAG